jgi:hypothetical protein
MLYIYIYIKYKDWVLNISFVEVKATCSSLMKIFFLFNLHIELLIIWLSYYTYNYNSYFISKKR